MTRHSAQVYAATVSCMALLGTALPIDIDNALQIDRREEIGATVGPADVAFDPPTPLVFDPPSGSEPVIIEGEGLIEEAPIEEAPIEEAPVTVEEAPATVEEAPATVEEATVEEATVEEAPAAEVTPPTAADNEELIIEVPAPRTETGRPKPELTAAPAADPEPATLNIVDEVVTLDDDPDYSAVTVIPADAAIISNCYALQGNGFNWGSTLSFLSEAFKIRYEEAMAQQTETGKPVFIHNDCVTGGSSGSAVATVFNGLMGNKVLLPETFVIEGFQINGVDMGQTRVYSPEQFKVVADAMRVLALSSDLSSTDAFGFLKSMVPDLLVPLPSMFSGTIKGLVDKLPLSDAQEIRLGELLPGWKTSKGSNLYNSPKWWTVTQTAYPAEATFATLGLVARNLNQTDIDINIKKIMEDQEKTLGKKLVEKIVAVAKDGYEKMFDVIRDDEGGIEAPSAILQNINKKAKATLDAIAIRLFDDYEPLNVTFDDRQSLTPLDQNPLNEYLHKPLRNGVCTSTMMKHFRRHLDMRDDLLTYDVIRPTFMCNTETIEVIINSPEYQRDVQDPESYASKFVLFEVSNTFRALDMGIREPSFFGVLAGRYEELGVTGFYDPIIDENKDFKMMHPFDQRFNDDTSLDLSAGIIGGYVENRMQAMIQSYYFGSFHSALAERGHATNSLQARFTKPDSHEFARHVLRNYANLDGGLPLEEAITDYQDFSDAYTTTSDKYFQQLEDTYPGTTVSKVAVHSDWIAKRTKDTFSAIRNGPLKGLIDRIPEEFISTVQDRLIGLPAAISGTSCPIITNTIKDTRASFEGHGIPETPRDMWKVWEVEGKHDIYSTPEQLAEAEAEKEAAKAKA